MYCENCGKQIDEDSDFCIHCGAAVGENNLSENESRKKNNKKAIAIVSMLLVLICLAVAIVVKIKSSNVNKVEAYNSNKIVEDEKISVESQVVEETEEVKIENPNLKAVNAEIDLNINDTQKLLYEADYDINLDYQSSDPSVVTVDANGVITALASGKVIITGRTDDFYCEWNINVIVDYKKIYKDFLLEYSNAGENNLDFWPGIRDYSQFTLVYINDDDVPELAMYGDSAHASQTYIYSILGGEIKLIGKFGCYGSEGIYYAEREGILNDLGAWNFGGATEDIYKLNDDYSLIELSHMFSQPGEGDLFDQFITEYRVDSIDCDASTYNSRYDEIKNTYTFKEVWENYDNNMLFDDFINSLQ